MEVQSLGFYVGAAATVALARALHALSRHILPPEGTDDAFSAAYLLLPGLVPALVALAVRARVRRLRPAAAAALKGAVLAEVLVLATFSCSPFGEPPWGYGYGPPGANASLALASSFDPATEPQPGPLSTWTADELTRRRRGQKYREITYVPADTPSTGPLVVSVNPIDDDTWGAAALSPRGRCYLILVVRDRANPRYGGTRYGWLPPGVPCVGSAANPATLTENGWPPR